MGKDIQEQSLVVETKCRFHLCSATPEQAVEIIQGLKDLGVKKVGPAHCTGDKDVQTWADDFERVGCGWTIKLEGK